LIRGLSHRPLTHSFAQAGWYPDLPVRRLSNRRGYTSSRPRKGERKSAIFSWDGEACETSNGVGLLGTRVSLAGIGCRVTPREFGVLIGVRVLDEPLELELKSAGKAA
jgi:hypothetical protein